MPTRTISVSEEAYQRLSRLKANSTMSFSDVILKYTPPKRTLSDVLKEFSPNPELAAAIEGASRSSRKARMREAVLDADS